MRLVGLSNPENPDRDDGAQQVRPEIVQPVA
jgi:hypothetical protein